MSLEVLSWNVRDGFSREEDARRLIQCVRELQPSVAVFPEAYSEEQTGLLSKVQEDFEQAGYHVTHGLYEDNDGRHDRHGLLSIVHRDVAHPDKPGSIVSLGNRNAIQQWVVDPESDAEIHVVGVHFNDRTEVQRAPEVASVLDLVTDSERVVLFGDKNGMHAESAKGLRIGIARILSMLVDKGIMPVKDPETIDDKFSLGKIGSLAKRLDEMASGETMRLLQEAGFKDADPSHQPTMPSRHPFAQLDHIMTRGSLTASNFTVLPHKDVTDHRGVYATVSAA